MTDESESKTRDRVSTGDCVGVTKVTVRQKVTVTQEVTERQKVKGSRCGGIASHDPACLKVNTHRHETASLES